MGLVHLEAPPNLGAQLLGELSGKRRQLLRAELLSRSLLRPGYSSEHLARPVPRTSPLLEDLGCWGQLAQKWGWPLPCRQEGKLPTLWDPDETSWCYGLRVPLTLESSFSVVTTDIAKVHRFLCFEV